MTAEPGKRKARQDPAIERKAAVVTDSWGVNTEAVIFRWVELTSRWEAGRTREVAGSSITWWSGSKSLPLKTSASVSPSAETDKIFSDSLGEEWCIIGICGTGTGERAW